MKVRKNKNPKRRIYLGIIISVIALLLIAGVVYAYTTSQPSSQDNKTGESSNGINYDEPTKEQIDAGNDAKKDAVDGSDSSNKGDISISSANINDGILQIRTVIASTDSSGKCNLTLSSPGMTDYTSEADTQSMGSYSVCKGFDIPISSLSPANWTIKIIYTNNGVSSTATQQVQVR